MRRIERIQRISIPRISFIESARSVESSHAFVGVASPSGPNMRDGEYGIQTPGRIDITRAPLERPPMRIVVTPRTTGRLGSALLSLATLTAALACDPPRRPAPPVPSTASAAAAQPRQERWPADRATPRTDGNSMLAHRQLLEKRSKGKIDVFFMGNSITRRWGATDYPQLLAHWRESFHGWNAANFGWGADGIEHMLWRIENGELDGVNPKVIVLLAGTNNVGRVPGGDAKVADIGRGLRALVSMMRRKAPNATIVLTGIFPREDSLPTAPAINAEIARINRGLAAMADGRTIRYVDVTDRLTSADGRLRTELFMDALHPNVRGYQVWAEALKPVLRELLGPPAAVDHAPPPTGDPSATNRRP